MDIEKNKNSQLLLQNEDTRYLSALLRNAVVLDFAPTPEVMAVALEMYRPLRIKPGLAPQSDHPLAAIHQRVATHRAHAFAKQHQPIVEIGPAPAQFMRYAKNNRKAHGCTMTSARDGSRFLSAAASVSVRGCSDRLYTQQVAYLAMGMETEKFCVRGYENCQYQAPFAVAVHSLYDIKLRDLAIGFEQHGTQILQAWMHLPMAALQADAYRDLENGCWFETYQNKHYIPLKERGLKNILTTKRREKRIRFGFIDDASFLYDHDYDTWMNYAKVGGFPTPFGFNVLIEKVRHNGTQWELKITRTKHGGMIYQRISSGLTNIVRIPDLFEMAKSNFCVMKQVRYIAADRDKTCRLFQFMVARDDRDFTTRAALAYARSLMRSLKVGQEVVETRWDVDPDTIVCITASVYVLAEIYRYRMREVLSMAKVHIQELFQKRSLWTRLVGEAPTWWKNLTHTVGEIFGSCEPIKLISENTRNHFARFALAFYAEVDTADCLQECEYNDLIDFEYLPIAAEAVNADIELAIATGASEAQIAKDVNNADPNAVVPNSHFLSWALELGLKAKVPTNDATAILSTYHHQAQHQIMIDELGRQSRDPNIALTLTTVLGMAHKAYRSRPPVPLALDKFAFLTGAPGAGKSGRLLSECVTAFDALNPGKSILVVVPTKDLKTRYSSALKLPHRAETTHIAASLLAQKRIEPALIMVDECFTYPVAFLSYLSQFANVIMMGDEHQVGHIDFSQSWGGCIKLTEFVPFIAREHMNVTRRCPHDIVALPFIQVRYPGITTVSKVRSSIIMVGPTYTREGAQVLTMTQDQKQRWATQGAKTVHEAQGGTFDSVILHLSGSTAEKRLLLNSPNHLVVGLTRHTVNLFVRQETEGLLMTYMSQDPKLVILNGEEGADMGAFVAPCEPPARSTDITIAHDDAAVPYVPECATVASTVEILHKLFPATQEIHEHQAVVKSELTCDKGAVTDIRTDNINDAEYESKKHTVYSFIAPQRLRMSNARHGLMSLSTFLARYAKITKSLPEASAYTEAMHLWETIQRFVSYDIPKEWREQAYLETVERFQEQQHDLSEILEVDMWSDQGANLVKYILKTQQKPDMTPDPMSRDKAGQGIAAHSKTTNFFVSVYTRLMERAHIEQAASKYHYISRYTDEEVLGLLDTLCTGKNYDHFEADWEEFDSSQNNVEHQFALLQLEAVGCPAEIRHHFGEMMCRRRVNSPILSSWVESKRDSGGKNTFHGNTSFNAAVVMTLVDPDTVDHMLFKGDDSSLLGHDIKLDEKRLLRLDKDCGFRLKIGNKKTGEFVSFITTPAGVSLNFPRIAGKVLSRTYRNKEDFDNYREAIGTTLAICGGQYQVSNMVRCNALHLRCPEEAIDHIASFLFNFARGRIPFDQTIARENRTVTTEPATYVGNMGTFQHRAQAGKVASIYSAPAPRKTPPPPRADTPATAVSTRRRFGNASRAFGGVMATFL
jgi:hypothetical protein